MNETRAPTNENIKEQVLEEYWKGAKPKELSEKTGISINTIKSWIKREKSKKVETKKDAPGRKKGAPSNGKKGAPPGNRNAKGAGAPDRNQNALRHGGYSAVYWDVLDDDEIELIEEVPKDEESLLLQQIQLFSIRERRIMQAVNRYRRTKEPVAISYTNRSESKRTFKTPEDEAEYSRRQQEKIDKKEILPGTSYSISTGTENKDNIIIRLESELSSVQAKKTKAIDSLIRLRLENRKLDDAENGNVLVDDWIASIMGEIPEVGEANE